MQSDCAHQFQRVALLHDTGFESIVEDDPFALETVGEVHVDGARRAFVVPQDVSYGLTRIFQALTNRRGDVGVFRSYDEAKEWLESAGSGAPPKG